MSEYDATTYERFSSAVRRQVQSMRIILDTLQVCWSCLTFLTYYLVSSGEENLGTFLESL